MKAILRSGIFLSIQRSSSHYVRFGLYAAQRIRLFNLKAHRENVASMRPKIQIPQEKMSYCRQKIFTEGNEFLLNIYKPVSIKSKTYPTVFFVHGTGYIMNERIFADLNARYLASLAKCQVINIEHSVAPEAPYPIPLNEVISAYNYLMINYKKYNINRQKFITLGYSSGTTFLSELAFRAKGNKKLPIKTNIMVAPFLDFSGRVDKEKSLKEYKKWGQDDDTIPSKFLTWIASLYIPKGIDLAQPALSPYCHSSKELSGIPPTEIIFGNKDKISHHAIGYAKKLYKAGVHVNLHIAKDENHSAFWTKLYFIHYVSHLLLKSFSSQPINTNLYKQNASIGFFHENQQHFLLENKANKENKTSDVMNALRT